MVVTRLCGSLFCRKTLQNAATISRRHFTRRLGTSASPNAHQAKAESEVENPTTSREPRKTTKKFSDLPSVYINTSGTLATPLQEWGTDLPTEAQSFTEPARKLARKPRSRKVKAPDAVKADRPRESAPFVEGVSEGRTVETGENATTEPATKLARKTRSRKKVTEESTETEKSAKDKAAKVPKPTTFLSRQILANLKRFPHCLLLTRVGQFYESYFDQAVEISRLLNIKLTSRKWNGERVAMCGFPLLHLDKHLKTLVQQEKRFVAMCEEFLIRPSPNVKEFERRIARIVTPGTLIDESFLNPQENNYLLAIGISADSSDASHPVGLAWIDVSTGEFFSKRCELENVPDELARIAPQEVVLEDSLQKQLDHPIFSTFVDSNCLLSYTALPSHNRPTDIDAALISSCEPSPIISAEEPNSTTPSTILSKIDSSSTIQESLAINLLTKFLQDNLLEYMPRLDAPLHENAQERMQIDLHTIQGLEIRESGHEGSSTGSLLSVVKRTTTSGGARLLARWLCSPSTSIQEINSRQSLVALFRSRLHFRMDICDILKEVNDVGRLCQKFLLGRADVSDLVEIRAAIDIWARLRRRFEHEIAMEDAENPGNFRIKDWSSLEALFLRLKSLDSLSEKISNSIIIDSEGLSENSEVDENIQELEDDSDATSSVPGKCDPKRWSIHPRYSEKLAALHVLRQDLVKQRETMELFLRSEFGAPSLTLRSAPGLGMFLHVARAKRDKKKLDLDPGFYSIGESLTTKSYIYKDWSQLGNKMTEVSLALHGAEKEVFEGLSLEVIEHAHQLRQNAQVIDELDVAIAFAMLAEEMNFVRPEISDDGSYHVVNGRHPSVEMGLLSVGRQFTPNSVDMTPASNLHLITGPNMAGKSTLLRQTAIIAILAQVGSCVPADYAHISVVDKLFSRIGAKDDLFRDRSTFMVEMLETADILRRATEKSLVIMDEVGRGTTVKDGLSIAFAALHHLVTVNKSRCLFATHFHELAEMVGNTANLNGSGVFSNIRFYCSDVDDAGDGHFTYSYRLRPGINRDSHGLKVARLAGVPPTAMGIAANTLLWLNENRPSSIMSDYNNFIQCTLKSAL
ncbi:hypothetical protein GALMADRAFT_149686 [Galerina marginata CBS 339.88]|uniref:DNA mismatch repair proteins mutS family domain-containing protein n=1 Tax=Galerina marginata (strain CBS 339.88) TaxID=685588 RepID=A0A067TPQ2_GALM3|nr:hypothetical protein GALMADRAFT_149686 [Galerina marginata CBS 339.88]